MPSPTLLSLLPPALPRLLLAAVLVPQTPRAARPWWMAASVACEAARLVVALTSDTLTGVAAVLDMVVFAGVYGSWAVIVTCVVESTRGGASGSESDVDDLAATAFVAQARDVAQKSREDDGEDAQGQPVSTSSSVSTDLGSFGESAPIGVDHNEYSQLQDRISTDLESLNLVCTTHQLPTPSPSHDTPESVPLSPGGWIASAHHLAAVPASTASESTVPATDEARDAGTDGLRRRCIAGDADHDHAPATTASASLSRALRSAASSIASFASASNLLLLDVPGADADADQEDDRGRGRGPELRLSPAADRARAGFVDASQVPLPASRSRLLVSAADDPADAGGGAFGDACQVPLPASRSRLLVADDVLHATQADCLLTPKPGAGAQRDACGGSGGGAAVGELQCGDARVVDGRRAAVDEAKDGAQCQGFQL